MSSLSVSDTQRGAIRSKIADLKSLLSCDGPRNEQVAVELAKLFASFPVQDQSPAATRLRMEAYFEALSAVPTWAIVAARKAITEGRTALDTRFAPTPPQLASFARTLVEPFHAALGDLEAIAEAAAA